MDKSQRSFASSSAQIPHTDDTCKHCIDQIDDEAIKGDGSSSSCTSDSNLQADENSSQVSEKSGIQHKVWFSRGDKLLEHKISFNLLKLEGMDKTICSASSCWISCSLIEPNTKVKLLASFLHRPVVLLDENLRVHGGHLQLSCQIMTVSALQKSSKIQWAQFPRTFPYSTVSVWTSTHKSLLGLSIACSCRPSPKDLLDWVLREKYFNQ